MTELETLSAENLRLKSEVDRMGKELEYLRKTMRALQRAHFGNKSERFQTEEQGLLFNEAEVLSLEPDTGDDENSDSTIEVKSHTKTRGHRKPLPENLEREIIKNRIA